MEYGFTREVSLTYDQALARTAEELRKEGFGILTTIDVRETLKQKLGVEFGRYMILGACNPPLAHRALMAEERIGMLLPCNVIVYEKEGKTVVGAFDPMLMVQVVGNPAIQPIAAEVKEKLKRVLDAL
jgi:uncharacterized protein (DUF302 family)